VGKTRLALQAAADVRDEFVDGLIFVALAAISDPALVIPTLAHDLALREEGAQPIFDRLQRYLHDKQQLLILDNFEQVIDAAPQVAALLVACPDLKCLVTSREPLRVQGEQEFLTPPLSLPDLPRLTQLRAGQAAALTPNKAVSLFCQRARAVKPDFQLNDGNALAVAEICRRLDGLPLALELAAVRLKLFSPQGLLDQLNAALLPLLTTGARDLPARQRTFAHTIQWSYDLLTAAEQQLFRQLTIFQGSFTLAAVQAVIGDWGLGSGSVATLLSNPQSPISLLDQITSLVDKNLLQQTQTSEETRFVMLATIHEFAWAQLQARDERSAIAQAHAAYYLQFAEQAATTFGSAAAEQWLQRLMADHDNLRAALRWALEQRATATALRLGVTLWRFWLSSGYLGEGRQWLKRIFELRITSYEDPVGVANLWLGAGLLAHHQGDPQQAMVHCQESLRAFRQLADAAGITQALNALAQVRLRTGQYDQAQTLLEESLALARQRGDQPGIAHALQYLGLLLFYRERQSTSARQMLEEAVALYQTLGNRRDLIHAQMSLGWVLLALAEVTLAHQFFTASFTTAQALGDQRARARIHYGLGEVALRQGDLVTARRQDEAALTLLIELGDKFHLIGVLSSLAAVTTAEGQPWVATKLLGAIEALRVAYGQALPVWTLERNASVVATLRTALGPA
jgi:predicted ATPase